MDNRLIVRVEFSADGVGRSDWNCDVQDPLTLKPMQKLPARAVDDALFAQNEMRDTRPMEELRRYSARRAEAIEHHFRVCARKLIAEIERQEGWPHAVASKEGE